MFITMMLQSMPEQGIEPAQIRNFTEPHIVIALKQMDAQYGFEP